MTRVTGRSRPRRHTIRRLVAWIVVLAVVLGAGLSLAPRAQARPGGGQSFGGGSSPSGGSSWSGGGSSSGSSGSSWGSGSSGSSSSGSSSSKSSWSWGSSGTSSNNSSWSSRPSYSAPWTARDSTPASPTGQGYTRKYGYDPQYPSTYDPTYRGPSGSLGAFFFWILVVAGVVVVLVAVLAVLRRRKQAEWMAKVDALEEESAAEFAREEARRRRYASIDAALAGLRSQDEAFSFIVFEDFLYALYSEIHTLRGEKQLDRADPYLSKDARTHLALNTCDGVTGIIVGAMRVDEVRGVQDTRRLDVTVVFTANYTEQTGAGEQSYYVEERWRLSRAADAKSRASDAARVIGCPNCGAPLDKQVGAKCTYCDTPATSEDHDWRIEDITELTKEKRGPILTGTTEERGTDLPTVVAPDAKERFAEIQAHDPAFGWTSFVSRVERIFSTFHATWSAQDLGPVRPFLSDALFETQQYWVNAYKSQALRNVTKDPTIVTVHCAKVSSDHYFQAITVRVFATCADYTVDAHGTVVGGDPKKVREYTEYWTLIRGAETTGAARVDPGCPSCGAPVDHINMAGSCDKCGVKVTTGTFDWVLSRIEQDEVYER